MNLEKLTTNLTKFGYDVKVFETKEEARDYIVSSNKDTTIGIGGCMTAKDMGLYEELIKNNEVYWHWMSKEADVLKKESEAKVYICSVNGVSENGELINIDGTCNRISSSVFGHEKVILVFGTNKIRDNYEEALDRAKNIAAVKNAIRLNKKTPCVKAGRCMDCNAPERICSGLTVLLRKPEHAFYEVVIVKEELGY